MATIISDIDGTLLAKGTQPMPKNIARLKANPTARIVLITGRAENQRRATEIALHNAGIRYNLLLMNNMGYTKDSQVASKTAHAQSIVQGGDVTEAIDNDPVMRKAYHNLGIKSVTY